MCLLRVHPLPTSLEGLWEPVEDLPCDVLLHTNHDAYGFKC
jgi:hypothetical protein